MLQDIPEYLRSGPTATVPVPPVVTVAQKLPFDQLTWEDFERLCLRLARYSGTPERVQLFGTRGEAQSGIDIYARNADGTYAVYQCKRYLRLSAADVRDAVTRFLEAEWAITATRFVFCTSYPVVATSLAREVEAQARRLRPVAFSLWDAEELCVMLRQHTQLVKEFFGRTWLERFCPQDDREPFTVAPRQLPPPLGEFVNRERDLTTVDRALSRDSGDAVPIVVLTGGHGVGKSATSRKWAHANIDRFTGGQLYANFSELRHHGGVGVGDVLTRFLRALNVPEEVIPPELDARTALFRSRTAEEPILVMLDDVDHAAQVRPLIPNGSRSAVLLTSRARLEELVAFDAARMVRLRPLDEASAGDLLAQMVDVERLEADAAAVQRLVEMCGGLPLALRICGARLASHDSRPVSWLVEELADEALRLRRMGVRPEQSLQVIFDESYRALGDAAAAMYRRAGLHPGPSFTAAAAAAAAGLTVAQAAELLEELSAAHLIEDLGDRYCFHDLMRIHARGAAARDEPAEQQLAALRRIVSFYLRAAQRMDHAMIPDRLRLTTGPPSAVAGEPSPPTSAAAFSYFESERANLLAALRVAGEYEWDSMAWQLGEALFLAYHNCKHPSEAVEIYEIATSAARRASHLEAEVRMLSQLAFAHIDAGEVCRADDDLARCRALMERSSHRELWASIREWTGVLEAKRGRYKRAVACHEQAREAFEEAGNRRGVALQELGIGRCLYQAGEAARAIAHLGRAVDLLDPSADALTFGRALRHLGEARYALGEREPACNVLERSVEVLRVAGAPLHEAAARESLAAAERQRGDTRTAAAQLRRALAIYSSLSSPRADLVGAVLDEIALAPV